MQVISVGKIHRDFSFRVNRKESRIIDEFMISIGGSATNTALALARLGTKCGIAGCVGSDWSDLKSFLKKEKVDLSNVIITESKTGAVLIRLLDNKKEMQTFPGADMLLRPEHLNKKSISSAEIVHLAGAKPDVCRKALVLSNFVTIDPGYVFSSNRFEEVKDIIGKIKFFFPTEAELTRQTGNNDIEHSVKMVMSTGLETLVLKRHDVITIVTKDGRFDVPIIKGNIVDISGCGDTFAAGFLYSHLKGKNLRQCAEFGIICAKLKTEKLGASSSPKMKDVKKEFSKYY